MKYFIGVDVGTSLIKAVMYNSSGQTVGDASCKVPVLFPQEGYSEQNMEEVWDGVASCIKSIIEKHPEKRDKIAALACAGQGDGLWALDKYGKSVGNAILWCDNRASGIVETWMENGIADKSFQRNGNVLWPGCTAAILQWVKENDQEYYAKIDTVFYCKDWINFKLTGQKATDYSDGTIPFMDIEKGEICREQIDQLGLDLNIYNKIPSLMNSFDVLGGITKDASEKTFLPEELPVVTGLIDVSANAIAAGAVETGHSFGIIGTTLINAVLLDSPSLKPAGVGFMLKSPIPGQFVKVMGSLSGTPNLDWYLREFFERPDENNPKAIFKEIEAIVKNVPPGANKVLFLPFLRGERSPFVNPNATASFFGLREKTTKGDMLRAVYEGVALAIRHNLTSVECNVKEIIVTGGGSADATWCQIFADVTGAVIRVPNRGELGTLGAAIMAAKGVGAIDGFAFDDSEIKEVLTYKPDKNNYRFYSDLYTLYLSTVEMMGSYWEQRNKLFSK